MSVKGKIWMVLVLCVLALFAAGVVAQREAERVQPWQGGEIATSTPLPQLLEASGTPWWKEPLPTPLRLATSTPTPTRKP